MSQSSSDFGCAPHAVSASAPARAIAGFRPASSRLAPLSRASASSTVIESRRSYSRSCLFGPSVAAPVGSAPWPQPNMPSADFWPSFQSPLGACSPFGHRGQISPGIAHPPSRLCLSDLRRTVPCKFRALMNLAISPRYSASYPLPVRQASALPSSFLQTRSRPRNPCLGLTLPLAGRVEDFHLQVGAPCRAHQKKSRLRRRRLSHQLALTSRAWLPDDDGPAGESCACRPAGRACRPARPGRRKDPHANFPRTCRCP